MMRPQCSFLNKYGAKKDSIPTNQLMVDGS